MNNISRSDLVLFKKDLLSTALNKKNNKEFYDYTFCAINEHVKIDSAILNLCMMEDNMMLGELKSYLYKQPQIMEEKYKRVSSIDIFTPIVLAAPRSIFHVPDLMSFDDLYSTDFYLKHCKVFDVNNGISASARIPGHKNKFLVLYLILGEPHKLFSDKDIHFVNDVFPVLCSTYLYCLGYICDKTLIEQVNLLNKFTGSPETMRLIKLIVNNPSATGKQYAKILGGKSPNTIYAQLQRISEKIGTKNHQNTPEIWNLKLKLIESFLFLRN